MEIQGHTLQQKYLSYQLSPRAPEPVGLRDEFASLPQDRPWTPYQRALCRRLAYPDYEPSVVGTAPDQPGSADFCATVRANMEEWDRNHDTRLSAEELDRAMARGGTQPAEDAALVVLRSRINSLGGCNPADGTGISILDLALFESAGIPGGADITVKIGEEFQELSAQAQSLGTALPLLSESFDPYHVQQNRLGSCVLLSTSVGLPGDQVKSMFETDAGSGNVVVTFRNGENEVVPEPTRAERLYHANTQQDGRWPALLEMAVGQYLVRHPELRHEVSPLDRDNSIRSAADGVPAEVAFELLTGSTAHKVSLDELSPRQTRAVMVELQQAPGPKICISRPELPSAAPDHQLEHLHNGIENSHAYTLVRYDAQADRVTLRNPWNRQHWVHAQGAAAEGGVFEMPFSQFYASFRWLASLS